MSSPPSSPTHGGIDSNNAADALFSVSRLAANKVDKFADGSQSAEKKLQLPLSLAADQYDNMYVRINMLLQIKATLCSVAASVVA
jgi:hypothetical protein